MFYTATGQNAVTAVNVCMHYVVIAVHGMYTTDANLIKKSSLVSKEVKNTTSSSVKFDNQHNDRN